MAILLAVGVSLAAGCSDFIGSLATRRAAALTVSAAAHVLGFVFTVLVALVIGGDPTGTDLLWGTVAGVGSAVGLTAIYHGYAHARVGIVAPMVGVFSTACPLAVSALQGDKFGPTALLGVGLGLAAITLVSVGSSEGPGTVTHSIGYGLVGAAGLGLLLVAFAQTSNDGGVWIVAPSRLSGLVVLSLMMGVSRTRVTVPRSVWPLIGLVGVLSVSANAMYAIATTLGSLGTVAVVASMFPAVTVAMAWLVFRERISRTQLVGFSLAVASVTLIATS